MRFKLRLKRRLATDLFCYAFEYTGNHKYGKRFSRVGAHFGRTCRTNVFHDQTHAFGAPRQLTVSEEMSYGLVP